MNGPHEGDRYTSTTNSSGSSTLNLQTEIDVIDTIGAAVGVFDGFTQGHHDDLDAIRIMCRAVDRKAHRAQVARINRPDGVAA